MYPTHEWLMWKFVNTPNRYWKSMDHQIQFVEWIKGPLNIKQLSDFYQYTGEDIAKHGGQSKNCL